MDHKTPSQFANNFYDSWNSIIKEWLDNEQNLNIFMDKKQSLSIGHVPEPYYGDMDNCSIVVINLNPGVGLCEQCWLEQDKQGTLVNYIKKNSYSTAAIGFPLGSHLSQSPVPMPTASLNWWKSRLLWIDRILDYRGVSREKRNKPFAIELVPLHSKSFNVADAGDYVENKYSTLLNVIEYALAASDSQMGLAIGKPICETLLKKGYKPIQNGGTIDNPLQPQNLKRYYCVLESPKGRRILCTWSSGSNKAPSDNLKEYEKNLISRLFCCDAS